MVINEKKTQFNGEERDKRDLRVGTANISYVSRYLYLGAWFTDTAKMTDVMNAHQTQSETFPNKLSIFGATNTSMPFMYKKRVFDDMWLSNKIQSLERQYNMMVK